MSKMIFTFWEGEKPAYINLCMSTWKFPFIELGYHNLEHYTDIDIKRLKRFTLPQIADCVRVHVLRDNDAIWLDADTIALSNRLPEETILGYPQTRENTIGFLRSGEQEMFTEWAKYQDGIISGSETPTHWSTMGNAFTDDYLKKHDIRIGNIMRMWPETYLISENMPRMLKYQEFYFKRSFHLKDIMKTDLLMLHNSWTPEWYKELSRREVLGTDCTLSNILNEI